MSEKHIVCINEISECMHVTIHFDVFSNFMHPLSIHTITKNELTFPLEKKPNEFKAI